MSMKRFWAIAGLLTLAGWTGQALEVQSGLASYQVVQCDAEGLGHLSLSGAANTAGTVQARVLSAAREEMPWADVGAVSNGAWQGVIEKVPAGGPYRVELRVGDAAGAAVETAIVYEVLVGDLWILAGQSNMQGVGNQVMMQEPHPLVHTFSMSHEWRLAKEPLHLLDESPDPVHCGQKTEEERQNAIKAWRDGAKGAGLGLPFAVEMVRRTGRPVGLIAAGHGGTSMTQWDPALRDQGGASLYGSMYKQVMNAGGKVRGALWYQGESDANPEAGPLFLERFKGLVAAMRQDFANPEMPFLYVQIGRFVVDAPDPSFWHQTQVDQLIAESQIPHSGMVPSIDLALDDAIHAGTQSLKILGYRLANLAERELFGGKVLPGPRVEKIAQAPTPYGLQVRVTFSGVNGRLSAAGRASGFSISRGPAGPPVACIFNQEPAADDPNTIILWVSQLPETPQLWYGRGMDPYCNAVDEANMAVPVFGPVPIP
jgi:sialate O-acetylesterase